MSIELQIAFAILYITLLLPPKPDKGSGAEHDNGESGQHRNSVPVSKRESPESKMAIPKSKKENPSSKNEGIQTAAEIAGVIIAAVLTVVTAYQLSAARQATKIEQRPWIQIDLTDVTNGGIGQPVGTRVSYFNTGRTPAKHVVINVAVILVNNGEQPSLSFNLPHRGATVGSIFPNENKHEIDIGLMQEGGTPYLLTADDIADLQAGRKFVVTYAMVEYIDVFGEEHFTKSCRWSHFAADKRMKFSAGNCTNYGNDVDNNPQPPWILSWF